MLLTENDQNTCKFKSFLRNGYLHSSHTNPTERNPGIPFESQKHKGTVRKQSTPALQKLSEGERTGGGATVIGAIILMPATTAG